ncbi:MAG: hypothetical protein AAF721_05625 [Myxococcota bacterium]
MGIGIGIGIGWLGAIALIAGGCAADPEPSPSASGSETSAASTDGTTGSPPAPIDTTAGESGPVSTSTGGVPLCGVADGDAPGFTLIGDDGPLPGSDAAIGVECGGQGAFMLNFDVTIAGIDTMGEEWVPFDVTIDVGDYDITGGHFIDRNVEIYVGCADDFQSDPTQFNLVLPDAVADPVELEGLPITMAFVMMPGTPAEVTFQTEGTLSASGQPGWDWCYGGGSGGPPGTSTGGDSGTDSGTDTGGTGTTTGGSTTGGSTTAG